MKNNAQQQLIAPKPLRVTLHDPKDEDSSISHILWLQHNPCKKTLIIIISALFAFLPLLFLKWSDNLRRKAFYHIVSFKDATHAWVQGPGEAYELVNVDKIAFTKPSGEKVTINKIIYRFMPYEYNPEENTLAAMRFAYGKTCKKMIESHSKCIETLNEIKNQECLYGKCQINVPMKSTLQIFIDELLNPFYLFQLFSVALWFWDGYIYYSSVIFGITAFSICFELIETKRNMTSIRALAKFSINVNCQRLNAFSQISSELLVPGDIIEVPRGKIPCDCALLSGSCVVNESVLTGESIPVVKAPLQISDEIYDADQCKKNTLYSGTTVIQTKSYQESQKVLAVVVRTGYSTTKGALVRSILYPRPNKFTFYLDSMKFIAVLAVFSLVGFFISLPTFIMMDMSFREIIDRSLDLITITVPPALPATLAIGTSFALHRLKKKTIYCISPPRVNVCGKVSTIVFDKTGTLTEEGLKVEGVHISRISKTKGPMFSKIKKDVSKIITQSMQTDNQCFQQRCNLNSVLCIEAMAVCHSIECIRDANTKEKTLIGDPLDLEMLSFTKWKYESPSVDQMDDIILAYVSPPLPELMEKRSSSKKEGNKHSNSIISIDDAEDKPYQIGLLRMFDFSAKLKRMSVVVKNLKSNDSRIYCKGAPEVMKDMCIKETIPNNFVSTLNYYAEKGCRVIALGTKKIKKNYKQIQVMKREDAECKLNFLGLLVMQNKLKDATISTIKELRDANITPIMATGDNILTAISVGKECSIVNSSIDMFLGEVEGKSLKWTLHKEDEKGMVNNDIELASSISSEVEAVEENIELDKSKDVEADSKLKEENSDIEPWRRYIKPCEVALTGEALDFVVNSKKMTPIEKKRLIHKAKIYARMSPENKAYLVEQLQLHNGTIVGMCGDGANDCAALRTADVGVSLSEAEASIAAPFTSKVQDISCIPLVLKEGRSALVTSFQCFKYMALYSMIQFCSVVLLYLMKTNLSDAMYLFIDLFIIIPFAATMSWSDASKKLTKQTPTDSLISFNVLSSVIGQIFLQINFQLVVVKLMMREDWFTPLTWTKGGSHSDYNTQKTCIESTVLFLITIVEYSSCVIAFTKGAPYRAPIWKNKLFISNTIIILCIASYYILFPANWANRLINLVDIPFSFRLVIAVAAGLDIVLTIVLETLIQKVMK